LRKLRREEERRVYPLYFGKRKWYSFGPEMYGNTKRRRENSE
jgi:hypothetical protein